MVAKDTAPKPREDSSTRRGARKVVPAGTSGGRTGGAARTETGARGASLTSFFEESRSELRKVTWPTREDATNLTVAVIAMTVAIAAFLGLVDGILDLLAKPILGT